mgnify:CR=1 FL=1|jgi:hypothetical protein
MKIIYIIIGILILVFIIIQIWALSIRTGIESYPFTVEKKYDNFEIRNYEASLFTSVKINTKDYKVGSSKGFSALGGYIFGANEKNQKISMTSPVTMSLGDTMEVMFLVPKEYNKDNLPKPNQKNIDFKEEPAKRVAAITFGGWADSEKIEKYKKELILYLDKEGISYTNDFLFMGYNPPFDMIGRKNEVIVVLDLK